LASSGALRAAVHTNGGMAGGSQVLITGGADIDFESIFADVTAGMGANSAAEMGANSMSGLQYATRVPLPAPPAATLPATASHIASTIRLGSPALSGATLPVMMHACSGIHTPRTSVSLPAAVPAVTYARQAAAASVGPSRLEEEAANWVRDVEANVEQAVGRSQQAALVAEDIARQEFFRAQHEAGAAIHHQQRIGAVKSAATLEMS